MKNIKYLFLAVLFGAASVSAQAVIEGKIIDSEANPVAGANIFLRGSVLGAASDSDGLFRISRVPAGRYRLEIVVIGFAQRDTVLTVPADGRVQLGEIQLRSVTLESQPVIVTASKYEQGVQDVPVSVAVLSAQALSARYTVTMDQALSYIPGVSLTGDQVNIRGSSGYSRGVGSRVMMLVDGMPFITGDTQGAVFEALPVNSIERIEVVKGSGSALYGSSAIGGVINVLTRPVSEQPEYNIRLSGGYYDDPYYDVWQWSDRSRYLTSLQASFGQRIGDAGLRLNFSQEGDDGYRRNNSTHRYHIGGKFTYDLTPFEKLTISGNYMHHNVDSFLYWKDFENALVPADDQIGNKVETRRAYLNTAYQQVIDEDTYLKVSGIWYHNHFTDNVSTGGNESTAEYAYAEAQYNTRLDGHFLTLGIAPSISSVTSNIFSNRSGYSGAVFMQDEWRTGDDTRLTAGLRLDHYKIDEVGSDYQFSPRLGLVYRPAENTAIRASAGSGFRAPSMAEAFTSTSASGIVVEPNPGLKAERSLSAEAGYNLILPGLAAFDLAAFYNYYYDLIEGGFIDGGKIRFDNVTEAWVMGVEVTVNGQLFSDRLTWQLGHTWLNHEDVTTGKFLKYRPRNQFTGNLVYRMDIFTLAGDYRYLGRYDEIDDNFSLVITDAAERGDAQVVDLRIGAELYRYGIPVTATLNVNNVLQYNYIDLIGSIAPIRHFVLDIETRF
jgi:outer membrane receptor for ferrienterochelin and colicins